MFPIAQPILISNQPIFQAYKFPFSWPIPLIPPLTRPTSFPAIETQKHHSSNRREQQHSRFTLEETSNNNIAARATPRRPLYATSSPSQVKIDGKLPSSSSMEQQEQTCSCVLQQPSVKPSTLIFSSWFPGIFVEILYQEQPFPSLGKISNWGMNWEFRFYPFPLIPNPNSLL